ncbi:hypothetical protein MTR67_051683 [Solanum verrucosum]|uniref:Retrotransposon gag domain-containing protein n=1 Tax=Solanum verrucosum TaxID=315347 RepID=A0AAF0V3R8_SOLVR|nr:hypothetical protein MTR67_051683 [Solanum verrucosum]
MNEGENLSQEAHLQAPQAPFDTLAKQVTNTEFRTEKAELATYKLKGVSQIWLNQWNETRPEDKGPLEWETFKSAFLNKIIPLEMRDDKVLEFINHRQGNMSVKEYALRSTQL